MNLSLRKVALLALAVALGCLRAWADAPAPPQDPLWQKAVEGATRTEAAGMVPGRLEMSASVKKPDGTAEEQSAMLFRIVYEGDESRTVLISATQNGKDVTEKAKAEEAKQERERKEKKPKKEDSVTLELEPGYHPFSPKSQIRVTARRTGDAPLDGRKAALFTFKESSEDGKSALEGRAWLDPETGAPLQVEASPAPLPQHVDTLVSTTRFETAPDGLWRPVSTEMRGEGGMLWIRRTFESRFRLTDWHVKDGKQP
jgi:hypothetical protein